MASLDEIRTNPYFAGGGCYSNGKGGFVLIYYLDLPVCPGVAPAALLVGRVAEPASC